VLLFVEGFKVLQLLLNVVHYGYQSRKFLTLTFPLLVDAVNIAVTVYAEHGDLIGAFDESVVDDPEYRS
jgi:hypothetical protein